MQCGAVVRARTPQQEDSGLLHCPQVSFVTVHKLVYDYLIALSALIGNMHRLSMTSGGIIKTKGPSTQQDLKI